MLVKSAPRALEGPPLSLYPQTGTSCPTGTSPSCSQVGGAAFPGARGEDTLAGRQQKTTLPERHAEPGQEERGFKRLARQAPTPGLLAAPVPGQGFSRTTLVKREGDTQHPRALAVTLTVGILRFPPWLRESKRLSAAGSLN